MRKQRRMLMDTAIVVSGVTTDELALELAGSGPGCDRVHIDPAIEEVKINNLKIGNAAVLKNLRVKIICPGILGAIQIKCEAATLLKKNSIKSSITGEKPLVVGDVLSAGLCTGTYRIGSYRTLCICAFKVKIIHSKQQSQY
jgi:hypothetical protein